MSGQTSPNKRKPAGLLKDFVEACGRHPFATGLFALLGVFGLIFSIYTYFADRAASAQSSATQATISEDVADIGAKVDNLPGAMPEPSGFVPISGKLDPYDYGRDNWMFDQDLLPEVQQALKFSEYGGLENSHEVGAALEAKSESISDIPFFEFSLSSEASRKFVQVAPYLVLDVQKVTKLSNVAMLYVGERGDAAQIRHFSGTVPAKKGFHYAPLTDPMTGKYRNDIDFFNIQPGETEEFFLEYSLAPGYAYSMRVGVHYKYDGVHQIYWVTPVYSVAVPKGSIPIISYDGKTNKQEYDGNFYSSDQIEKLASQNRDRAFRSGLFNPGHIE